MPKLSSPPANWDPNTVVGVRERIKISGFGIKKPLNFEDQITNHKWKYAADVVIAQRPSLMDLLPDGDGDLPDGDVPGWSDVYTQRVVDMVEDKHTEDVDTKEDVLSHCTDTVTG
jgi:hypothetical protein